MGVSKKRIETLKKELRKQGYSGLSEIPYKNNKSKTYYNIIYKKFKKKQEKFDYKIKFAGNTIKSGCVSAKNKTELKDKIRKLKKGIVKDLEVKY